MPNYSKKPLLKETDEEYLMLIEVTEEFEKQKTDKTILEKYGKPTEIVLRNHLTSKGLNISKVPKVTIQGSKIENDLVLLKNGVDPNQTDYPPGQVKMVIKVKNNGAAGKILDDEKREDPNKELKTKFNELEALTNVKNYAVIVMSETLLPPKGLYKWRFKQEVIGKENCKVFTLVARGLYPPGGLYLKANIEGMLQKEHMRKTQELEELVKYLKCL
ncbi:MAG: hypothetical protein ACFCUE_08325 [Candidatus Bathyarchaeia archaeon]|jgi:hypothetical protein